MVTESEAALERRTLLSLLKAGYERVSIKNEQELEDNFRIQLSELNKPKLSSSPLTDGEWRRLLVMIKNRGVFAAAKQLRDKVELQRDTGEYIQLDLLDFSNTRNKWQVANQITLEAKRANRYDVTLLLNGLPVVQIELKKAGIELKSAFNQINRYRRDTYTGLFEYLQFFIISNGKTSKYFANSPSSADLPYEQVFNWADVENKKISDIEELISSLLKPSTLNEILHKFMVLISLGEKRIMVMRPYQVYAAKAAINHLLKTDNNGYIWHATGSGKTLTSFKIASLLASESKFESVIFLVDRRDLNGQTAEEFNKFEEKSVAVVDNRKGLIDQLKDPSRKLIVTTIQRLSKLAEEKSAALDRFKDKRVLFVIDECHRSQFGKMHKQINKHFKEAQYLGFTGTPRFADNQSQDKRTTADIFKKCLHAYRIQNAIADKNVLPFNVDYIQTAQLKKSFDDYEVESIDTDEIIHHESRVKNVAEHISSSYAKKTRYRQYNAMLAVTDIPLLNQYYKELRKQNPDLKITAVYTSNENEDLKGGDKSSRDELDNIIKDYDQTFNTNFFGQNYSLHAADVMKRLKNKDIDLLIVVDMMLTGVDSPLTNTMYFDKKAVYHNLIQAISRTNRIESENKTAGNIVFYQPLKKELDEALILFSQSEDIESLLTRGYKIVLDELKSKMDELIALTPTPESVDSLSGEYQEAEYVQLFKSVSRLIAEISPYTDFDFEKSGLPLTEQQIADYRSKYLELKESVDRGEKTSVLSDIDFDLSLIAHDTINRDYIRNLIGNLDLSKGGDLKRDAENILKQIKNSSDESLRLKSEHLENFLKTKLMTLPVNSDVTYELNLFEVEERAKEIANFSSSTDIPDRIVERWIEDYNYNQQVSLREISDDIKALKLKLKLSERASLKKEAADFIIRTAQKY